MKNRDELAGKVPAELTPQKYPEGEMTGEVDYTEGQDITHQHAVSREQPEPSLRREGEASLGTFPLWLVILCGVAIFWAGGYLLLFSGAFRSDVYSERRWEPGLFFASAGGGAKEDGPAEKSPIEKGEIFFKQNCATCHQATGQGAAGQYPTLVGTEWVVGNNKRLAAILLRGLQGPITIKGQKQSYSGVMQAWGPSLTDEKIAYILTYIRQAWGNQAGPITPEQMAAARAEFQGQAGAMTEETLQAIPEDDTLPGGEAAAAPAAGAAGAKGGAAS